jgi:hypothetical protein
LSDEKAGEKYRIAYQSYVLAREVNGPAVKG